VTNEELWYINRGTGMVLLAMISLSVVLGILATERISSRWWPRFLTQGLHRNLSLLSLALGLVHSASAVIDEFVDIRWWHAVVPFTGTYKTFWLGLGTVAFDLVVANIVTSLLRHRLGLRTWRGIHLTTYAVFALSVGHGLGLGTDAVEPWSLAVTLSCLVTVMLATAVRLAALRRTVLAE
jgi:methionine sulfoxide reductase heme-binding subunit